MQKLFTLAVPLLFLCSPCLAQSTATMYALSGFEPTNANSRLHSVNVTTGTTTQISSSALCNDQTSYDFHNIGSDIDSAHGIYYFTCRTNHSMIGVDIKTGNIVTDKQLSPANYEFESVRFNPADNLLYGISRHTVSPTNSYFAMLDPKTGVITNITSALSITRYNQTEILDYQHQVYYVIERSGNTDKITGFDLKTGAIVSSKPLTNITGTDQVAKLAYNSWTGIIYGLAGQPGKDEQKLVSINQNTGAVTYISNTSFNLYNATLDIGFCIDPVNKIYYHPSGKTLKGVSLTNGQVISSAVLNPDTAMFGLKIYAYNPLSVHNISKKAITISPNPSRGNVHIHFPATSSHTISIADITGRIIYNAPVNNTPDTDINTSSLMPGLYLLQVHIDDNIYTEKLIVE